MAFPDIPGAFRAKKVLLGAYANNRVPNAYLFSGNDAAAMESAAKAYAKLLNCDKMCGVCASCRKIESGTFADYLVVSPEGRKKIIKIDSIRGLKERIRYGPAEGKWMVAILKSADRIEAAASNSFLKVLEEPPGHVLFILISERDQNIPGTVISRCQRVFFGETGAERGEIMGIPDGKDILDYLRLAKDISETGTEREDVESGLRSLLSAFHSRRMIKETRAVLAAMKSIKQMANIRLALDNMALELSAGGGADG